MQAASGGVGWGARATQKYSLRQLLIELPSRERSRTVLHGRSVRIYFGALMTVSAASVAGAAEKVGRT
jgi:hypothetical protein